MQYVSQDKALRAEYEARLKEISDFNAGIANARKEEREKAKAEKIESAKNLLKAGISAEIIASSLGLSLEEIKEL